MPDGTDNTTSTTAPSATVTTPAATTANSTTTTATGFKPPASQDELDSIIETRIAREKAKYADYDTIKSRLTEIEDADKTELQRAEAARDAAAQEAAAHKRELSILRAASKHGVPADYVDLIDGADDEAIEAKALKIAELVKEKGAAPAATVPSEPFFAKVADPGQSSAPAPDEAAVKEAFARQLFQLP
jgi:hypothetical protein